MGRLIAIVLFVGAIWTAVEIQTYGTEGAFGGKLASLMGESNAARTQETLSTPRRAGQAVERAHQAQQERYEELLDD